MTGVVVITTTMATTVIVMVAPMAVMAQAMVVMVQDMVVMVQDMVVMVQDMVVMVRVGAVTAARTAMDSNSRGANPRHRHFLNKLPNRRDSSDKVNRKSPAGVLGFF